MMNTQANPTAMPQVAVIGCGLWGKNLVRNFFELGALAALCDPDRDKAGILAAQFKAPTLSEEQVFTSPDIQGIVVSSLAPLHLEHAERALKAGKHVYVEKPMALTTKDAQALCDLAKANDLTLMVGHILNYHPAFIALKEQLPKLGTIRHIYANRLGLGRFRHHESVLWDLATHDVSLILSLVQDMPTSVLATWQSYLTPRKPASALLTLNFPGDITAHIHASWISPFKEQKLVVIGEHGIAVFDDRKPWAEKLQFSTDCIQINEDMPRSNDTFETVNVPLTESEPLRNECLHFLTCIQNKEEPLTSGLEGLRVTQVLEQAETSLNKG